MVIQQCLLIHKDIQTNSCITEQAVRVGGAIVYWPWAVNQDDGHGVLTSVCLCVRGWDITADYKCSVLWITAHLSSNTLSQSHKLQPVSIQTMKPHPPRYVLLSMRKH